MPDGHGTISLGFTKQLFPPGVHVCQVFSDDEQQKDAALEFLFTGLKAGEQTCCFSERIGETMLSEFLEQRHISYEKARDSGALTLSGTSDIYFQDGYFDPERMLSLLRIFYEDSVKNGYPAARVIGEMTSEVQHLPGGSRLLEYEAKVSLLLRNHPVSTVCQYDARSFDGATIMDVLKVHPLMILRGSVVHNPFFIPPEEYLSL